ncbi:unnamed protein product [Brassica rapa]|uniref:Uncharacterized protein n=1 Tax=Brassica campestris TaxID=3711 RepID=A0A8D9GD71_BRACM|nr:unnamed protein product [Brassica rapa]
MTRTVHMKGQRAVSKDQRADMCTDGQPRTSYSPRGPKSPKQSTRRARVLSPRTNGLIYNLCVLTDTHRRPVCADGHTQTLTDVLCVLTDSHGRPTPADFLYVLNIQPTWAKITQTVHRKGQRAESRDQRADMCTDGQPRTSCTRTHTDTHGHTRTATNVLCVLTDSHGQPRTLCVCWWTPTDVLCVLNRQPMWAKITQTVHEKGQRAKSKDQRADMYTDGQPRTATDVLSVLADTHGRPVCTEQTAHNGQNHSNSPREGSTC